MFGKADIVDYTAEDLNAPNTQSNRFLGEQSEGRATSSRCPLQALQSRCRCPEVAAWQMLPSVQAKATNGHVTPKVATELVDNISLLDCRKIWKAPPPVTTSKIRVKHD